MPLTYQWQRKHGVGSWTDIPLATAAHLTFPAVVYADNDGDKFRCKVSNAYGTTITAEATLTVNAIAPSIVAQPTDQTVDDGDLAGFAIGASGTLTLHYQWQSFNGLTWDDIGSDQDSIDVSLPFAESGKRFRCIVSNAGGSVTSDEATVTVNSVAPGLVVLDPQADGIHATMPVLPGGETSLILQKSDDGGSTWHDHTTGLAGSAVVTDATGDWTGAAWGSPVGRENTVYHYRAKGTVSTVSGASSNDTTVDVPGIADGCDFAITGLGLDASGSITAPAAYPALTLTWDLYVEPDISPPSVLEEADFGISGVVPDYHWPIGTDPYCMLVANNIYGSTNGTIVLPNF